MGRELRVLNCVDEWVEPIYDEHSLNELVFGEVLPYRETAHWQPTYGESFSTPDGNKLVVFRLGMPVHPFLVCLLEFYSISLCNLGMNSILHVSVFIYFCEAYLGIAPHFDLWHYFFCLKIHGELGPGLLVVLTSS